MTKRYFGLALLAVFGTLAIAGCGGGQGIPIFFQSDRDGNWEIYSIWHDGTMETRVTNNSVSDTYPAVSHDGTRVAFIRDTGGTTDIILMNVDLTGETNITNGAMPGAVESLSWFHTNDRMILAMSDPAVANGRAQVYQIDDDGSNLARISQDDTLSYRNPRIKTQGGEIAVSAGPSMDALDIHLLTMDGTYVRLIPQETFRVTGGDFEAAGNSEDYPEYDPTGRAVLFQSNITGTNHIWRVEADGRRPVDRSADQDYNNTQPSWSGELDSFTMAFVSDRDGNPEIYLRSLSTREATRLTNNSATDSHPSWVKKVPSN